MKTQKSICGKRKKAERIYIRDTGKKTKGYEKFTELGE